MKPESIKAVFTNLLFVIGIILMIIGFVQGSLTATRLIAFDKYPLQSYEETRCEIEQLQPMIEGKTMGGQNEVDYQKRQNNCKEALEKQRNIKKVEDAINSVAFLIAGVALTISFRRFILK